VQQSNIHLRRERKDVEKSVLALRNEVEGLSHRASRDRRSASSAQGMWKQLENAKDEVYNLYWQHHARSGKAEASNSHAEDVLAQSFQRLETLKEQQQGAHKEVEAAIATIDKSKLARLMRLCCSTSPPLLSTSLLEDLASVDADMLKKEVARGLWIKPAQDCHAKLEDGKTKAEKLQAEVSKLEKLINDTRSRGHLLQERLRQEQRLTEELEGSRQEKAGEIAKLMSKLSEVQSTLARDASGTASWQLLPQNLDRYPDVLEQLVQEPALPQPPEDIANAGDTVLDHARSRHEVTCKELAAAESNSEKASASARAMFEGELRAARQRGELSAWQAAEQRLGTLRRCAVPPRAMREEAAKQPLPAVALEDALLRRETSAEQHHLAFDVGEFLIPLGFPPATTEQCARACALEATRSNVEFVAKQWQQEITGCRREFLSIATKIADGSASAGADEKRGRILDMEHEVHNLSLQLAEDTAEVRLGSLHKAALKVEARQAELEAEMLHRRGDALQKAVADEQSACAEVNKLEEMVQEKNVALRGVAGQRQKLEAMLKSTEQRGIEAQESIEKDAEKLRSQLKQIIEEVDEIKGLEKKMQDEHAEYEEQKRKLLITNKEHHRVEQAEMLACTQECRKLEDEMKSAEEEATRLRLESEEAQHSWQKKRINRENYIATEEALLEEARQMLQSSEAKAAAAEEGGIADDVPSEVVPAAAVGADEAMLEAPIGTPVAEQQFEPTDQDEQEATLASKRKQSEGDSNRANDAAEPERKFARRQQVRQGRRATHRKRKREQTLQPAVRARKWQRGRWFMWQRQCYRLQAQALPVGGPPSPEEAEAAPIVLVDVT